MGEGLRPSPPRLRSGDLAEQAALRGSYLGPDEGHLGPLATIVNKLARASFALERVVEQNLEDAAANLSVSGRSQPGFARREGFWARSNQKSG
jgi:hypothetical protein